MKRTLGVCYYPEHWPEEAWAEDAARMARAGIRRVRIGEFAWARIEPRPGDLRFGWLDRAIDTLGSAGLEVVLGTPTATPPRWMLDRHPGMAPVDARGRTRGFGSRRHYCFSHDGYREESRRIAGLLAERYGRDPRVVAWQTDNEYDCHHTALSYSPAALDAFREWCARRYGTVEALNRAWGNVFWSMEYGRFDEIGLPNQTVTEPNPAQVLAFRRFSSDQVLRFNRVQCDELRRHSNAPIVHNFMGRMSGFDHHRLGADLDFAAWDSYPLGFLLDRAGASAEDKARFLRQGHPDFQAFHHDLYRSCGRGRFWVMEQQPGPVNWAPWNPAPLPGMLRLWAWEAFAHGAETVCFFRWRQAPFGQEQMHAGLIRPDGRAAPGLAEVSSVAAEIEEAPDAGTARAQVALVYDYPSAWAWEAQPHGADFDYFALCFDVYRALRRAGLSIDVIPPDARDLRAYALVMAPGLLELTPGFTEAVASSNARIILGPRAGLKTAELSTPAPMGPRLPGISLTVTHVESLPPFAPVPLAAGGAVGRWFEALDTDAEILERTVDGRPVLAGGRRIGYLAGWPDERALDRIVRREADARNLPTLDLPSGLRVRDAPFAPVLDQLRARDHRARRPHRGPRRRADGAPNRRDRGRLNRLRNARCQGSRFAPRRPSRSRIGPAVPADGRGAAATARHFAGGRPQESPGETFRGARLRRSWPSAVTITVSPRVIARPASLSATMMWTKSTIPGVMGRGLPAKNIGPSIQVGANVAPRL